MGLDDTSNAKTWKGSSGADLASTQDTSAAGNDSWHLHLEGIHQQSGDSGTDLLQEKAWGSWFIGFFFPHLVSMVLFYALFSICEMNLELYPWAYTFHLGLWNWACWDCDKAWVRIRSRDTNIGVNTVSVGGQPRAIGITDILQLISCEFMNLWIPNSEIMNTKQYYPCPSKWVVDGPGETSLQVGLLYKVWIYNGRDWHVFSGVRHMELESREPSSSSGQPPIL